MKSAALLVSLLLISFLSNAVTLKDAIVSIEQKIAGRVGVAVLDTQNDEIWDYNGSDRFPMMSTFKALMCANMFQKADAGLIDQDKSFLIDEDSLVVWSPVTEKLVGSTITTRKACEATMLTSDNTAANIVLQHLGGPENFTSFVRAIGDNITRLDRIEPELNEAKAGDVRDTTSPIAMVNALRSIFFGKVLTKDSATELKNWMQQNIISSALLRAELPHGWMIADRTGAGENGSRGITALIWNENRNPLILAIYLTETDLSLKERNLVIAEIGKNIFVEFDVKTPS